MADIFPGFKINDAAYDRYAKEIVRISNCICILDHRDSESFRESHKRNDGSSGCTMVPCEAVALRCVGVDAKGNPRMAYTYRKVDPDMLSTAGPNAWIDPGTFRRSLFIGRV